MDDRHRHQRRQRHSARQTRCDRPRSCLVSVNRVVFSNERTGGGSWFARGCGVWCVPRVAAATPSASRYPGAGAIPAAYARLSREARIASPRAGMPSVTATAPSAGLRQVLTELSPAAAADASLGLLGAGPHHGVAATRGRALESRRAFRMTPSPSDDSAVSGVCTRRSGASQGGAAASAAERCACGDGERAAPGPGEVRVRAGPCRAAGGRPGTGCEGGKPCPVTARAESARRSSLPRPRTGTSSPIPRRTRCR